MLLRNRFRKALKAVLDWAMKTEDFHNKSMEADSIKYYSSSSVPVALGRGSKVQSLDDNSRGMNITVFRATGGQVIQTSQYDPRTDRSVTNLYVVHDTDDLGAELSQIITRENLSR